MTTTEKQAYIERAMALAQFEQLEDGEGWTATVPGLPGVLAHTETESTIKAELRSVLEGWIALGEQQGHSIPELQCSVDCMFRSAAALADPCEEYDHQENAWTCSLKKGHPGPHIACGGKSACQAHIWENSQR